MADAALPVVTLYGRPGCHLCEEARTTLDALLAGRAAAGLPTATIAERDIDQDPIAHDAFFETIPVVEHGDLRLELATSPSKLRRFLETALDSGATGSDASATGREAWGAAPAAASPGDVR